MAGGLISPQWWGTWKQIRDHAKYGRVWLDDDSGRCSCIIWSWRQQQWSVTLFSTTGSRISTAFKPCLFQAIALAEQWAFKADSDDRF